MKELKELEMFLKTVAGGLKLLVQGVETIAETVDSLAKAQEEETPKESPLAEPSPEAPAEPEKKKIPIKAEKEKAPKKEKTITAADAVLNIIKRSKEGVDTATLKKKTGFGEKKIYNITYKLKNQGKIKPGKRGIYMKA
ncbi:MAG: hypothetical protein JRG68_05360 [Deltaproteobacteria bacterium]|nr:hypothetical protein [Deltaproteobacteria bacterium]MBW1940764.1 hypothetical protein [Deltaproteobacteria bacterium]MBW2011257.1 hypothetical protein [Deltaproteobacteria bacterium]MBW2100181.1 hypothetical protein [Deltaproteobacteria bacterium]